MEPSRRRAATGLAIAVLACVPLRDAGARDFTAGTDQTYQRTYDDGGLTYDSYQQVYTVGFKRLVSEPLSYRLTLAYEQANAPIYAPGRVAITRSTGPRLVVNYALGNFSLASSYSFHWGESSYAGNTSTQTAHNVSFASNYRISDRAGTAVQASRVAATADGRSSTVDRLVETLSYSTGKLGAGQNLLVSHHTQNGFDRLMLTPGASVAYEERLLEGKLAVTASEGLSYNWMRESSASGGAVDAPRPLSPAAGLYGRVELPADTSLDQMATHPALVDHDLDASAGVDLGPSGLSFNNLGVDMGSFAKVDQFEVHVRDAGGRFVRSGGDITWTAWHSLNGRQWTPLQTTWLFDTALSRYIVWFPATTARYFKVVNFNVNSVATFVTEIVPLITGTFSGVSKRYTTGLGNSANLSLQALPRKGMSLSYSGTLSNNAQSSPSSSLASWSHGHGVSASLKPSPPLTLNVGGEFRETHVGDSPTLRSASASTGAQLTPIPRATAALTGFVTLETYAQTRVETEGASLSLSGSPLETFQLSLSGTIGRADANGQLSTNVNGSAAATAKLRPTLVVTGMAIFSRVVAGTFDVAADVPITRVQDIQSYTGSVRYQPSSQLFVVGHVGYFEAGKVSGLSEGGMLSWVPFQDGPLSLRTSYAHDIDSTNGTTSRRLRLEASWNVSRHFTLSSSYLDERSSMAPPRQAIFLTGSARI